MRFREYLIQILKVVERERPSTKFEFQEHLLGGVGVLDGLLCQFSPTGPLSLAMSSIIMAVAPDAYSCLLDLGIDRCRGHAADGRSPQRSKERGCRNPRRNWWSGMCLLSLADHMYSITSNRTPLAHRNGAPAKSGQNKASSSCARKCKHLAT